jgi:hypothetical protein
MTRRLKPPVPVAMTCTPDGTPLAMRRGGRTRTVSHIAATWVRPASWWLDDDAADDAGTDGGDDKHDVLLRERAYYRVVVDGVAVLEIFRSAGGQWYLERIID